MSYHYSQHNLMKDQNLFIAAKCGDINLLRDLLNAGYPISHKDKYGKTALHHAVEGVHLDCVLELVKNNVQYHHRDNQNRTPLDVAFDVTKRLDDGRKPDMQKIIDNLSVYRYQ